MDKKLIQDLKNSWRNVNAATVGFLQSIPADKVAEKPFTPRFTEYAGNSPALFELDCVTCMNSKQESQILKIAKVFQTRMN